MRSQATTNPMILLNAWFQANGVNRIDSDVKIRLSQMTGLYTNQIDRWIEKERTKNNFTNPEEEI